MEVDGAVILARRVAPAHLLASRPSGPSVGRAASRPSERPRADARFDDVESLDARRNPSPPRDRREEERIERQGLRRARGHAEQERILDLPSSAREARGARRAPDERSAPARRAAPEGGAPITREAGCASARTGATCPGTQRLRGGNGHHPRSDTTPQLRGTARGQGHRARGRHAQPAPPTPPGPTDKAQPALRALVPPRHHASNGRRRRGSATRWRRRRRPASERAGRRVDARGRGSQGQRLPREGRWIEKEGEVLDLDAGPRRIRIACATTRPRLAR